eukprot:TRINITY_DN18933_c0_g1_i1.p1 TRINITY_DN18933_c0_g1~~TRINITY_DN18933_c0_g1_i1.p1  ORF type:complete len:951 (+),score=181.68 TRINITY_DN18933_c0_g1_i1:71-2854(+)
MSTQHTFIDKMTANLISDSGLLIAAAGLGALEVVSKLVETLIKDDDGLTLLLNATPELERFVDDSLSRIGIPPDKHPSKLHVEVSPKVRDDTYRSGQICSISSHYLIVDILSDRLQLSTPTIRLKRCLVWDAHKITSSDRPESFVIRMLKEKCPSISIHCITDSPHSFIQKGISLNVLLRNLCVNKVWLWPRFHVEVQKDMETMIPLEVVEMNAKLPKSVEAIQASILTIIEDMVSELRNKLPKQQSGTSFELSAAGVVTGMLTRYLKEEIGTSNIMSETIKRVINELDTLKKLLRVLHSTTSVEFLEHLEYTLRVAEGSIGGGPPASWLMSSGAKLLLPQAKSRIFRFGKIDIEPEQSFRILTEIMKDITSDFQTMGPGYNSLAPGATFTGEQQPTVLILVKDKQSMYNVLRVLHNGERAVMQNLLKQYVKDNYTDPTMIASQLKELHPGEEGVDDPQQEENPGQYCDREEMVASIRNAGEAVIPDGCFDLDDDDDDANIDFTQPDQSVAGFFDSDSSSSDSDCESPRSIKRLRSVKTPPSIKKKKADPVAQTREALSLEVDRNFTVFGAGSGPNIIVHTVYNCSELLERTRPGWVIMYEPNVAAIRKMEVFSLSHPEWKTRVYVMGNTDSTEQQKTLTVINNEMSAFKWLASKRASLASNESLSSNTDSVAQQSSVSLERSKRSGGLLSCIRSGGKVLIDTREFRCKLPSAIYRSRLVPIPVFIEVADYVLTNDIAVERKSIPDLMGSLLSGRLLQQIESLDKKYLSPVLLIEFEGNQPFCLTAGETWDFQHSTFDKKLWQTERMTPSEKTANCLEKLIALSVLFPSLRILWSRDQSMTARLFEEIKRGKPEPSEDAASSRDANHTDAAIDFLKKIPNVTAQNVHVIAKNFASIADLSQASKDQLISLIGEVAGTSVWRFFNDPS